MASRSNAAALGGIMQAYADWCKPLCRELGLPRMAFDILMFLSVNPELCTARDINRYQGFKENVLSVNVNKLVSEGYLERRAVEGDRRKVRLILTDKAQPIIARGRRAQEEFSSRIKEGMTARELVTFAKCLGIAGENARKIRADASYLESLYEEQISISAGVQAGKGGAYDEKRG